MKAAIIAAISLCIAGSSIAQTVKSQVQSSKWSMYTSDICSEQVIGGAYTSSNKHIWLSPQDVIFPVSYDNSSGAFVFDDVKLKYGVVRMNQKGQTVWEQKINGLLINISRYGDQLLVISTDQKLHRHVAKEIRATLVNISDGKIVKEKVLLTNDADKFVEVKVFNKQDGQFAKLMVRSTHYKGGMTMNLEKQIRQSTKLEFYGIAGDLEAKAVQTITPDEKAKFVRAALADNGNLFLFFENDKQLLAEKYHPDEKVPVRIMIDNDVRRGSKEQLIVRVNPTDANQVLGVLNGVESIVYLMLDFNSGKATRKEEQLNKEYVGQLQFEDTNGDEFGGRKKIKDIEYLQVKDVHYYGKDVVVAKEISIHDMDRSVDFETIISVYGSGMELKKNFVLPKSYASRAGGYGDSYNIRNGLYHYLGNSNSIFKSRAVYACIDLDNLKLKKISFLKDASQKIISDSPILPNCTLWFDEGFVIDRRDWSFTKGLTSNANLELVSYD